MSEQNAELVRRTFEALQRRAYTEAARSFRDDAVWRNTEAFPGPRVCVGRAAIIDFWTTLVEDFEKDVGGQRIQRLAEGENVVVIAVQSRGRGRLSGAPIDITWAAVFEVRDGSIVRVDVHGDWSKAVKAAGLER